MLARDTFTGALLAILLLSGGTFIAADDYSELDGLKNHDNEIVVNFKDTDLSRVLGVVAMSGNFKLTLGESFQDTRVSIPEQKTTIKSFLVQLAQEQALQYSVPNAEELIVESGRRARN